MPKYKDDDLLPRRLRRTVSGKRYLRACLIMRLTALEIRLTFIRLSTRQIGRDVAEPLICRLRLRYTMYSDKASAALDEVHKRYGLSSEAAADESFRWQPMTPTVEAAASVNLSPRSDVQKEIRHLVKNGFKLIKVGLPPAKDYLNVGRPSPKK